MTDKELNVLIVKDTLVRQHGYALLAWSLPAWRAAVDQYLDTFEALPSGQQSQIRMRYK